MIETERLRLRGWMEADKPRLAAIQADPDVMRFLGGVKTHAETSVMVDRLVRVGEAGEPVFWAVERLADGELIGAVGLHRLGAEFPFGPALEVGWRLGRGHWGKGYATEAGRASLQHAFAVLDESRVYAFTAIGNARSEAVMRRIGMTKVDSGEFAHPDLPTSDPLSRHVLYVAERQD